MMTDRQSFTAVGFTHASSVIPAVRFSEVALATVTSALVPLNDRALPNLPVVAQVALVRVPLLLLPDESAVVVPVPSSTPRARTGPVPLAVVIAQVKLAGVASVPFAFTPRTWNVCDPTASAV